MGRNIYSQNEIDHIRHLLDLKCAGTRFQQKQVRHILRTEYEFNISDFGEQGVAFGPRELDLCVRHGAIRILDDATMEAIKAKRARDKARDAEMAAAEAAANPKPDETTDWQQALKEWEAENGPVDKSE